MSQVYVPLAGSERLVPAGARYLGAVNPNEWIEVSVYLRSRAPVREALRQSMRSRERVAREEYSSRYGAHGDDLEQVRQFAEACNLVTGEIDRARRLVVLAGTAAVMGKAFRTELHYWQRDGRTYRGRTG